MSKKYLDRIIIIGVILLLASARLIKHPLNFTPITAMALFSGCYMKKYRWLIVPFLALFISDLFIGLYDIKLMFFVYLCFLATFLLGRVYSNHKRWYILIVVSIISSVIFFLFTNASVWIFTSWYPKTLAGLETCFMMAIPFFRNTIAGDLVYSVIIFGFFEFVTSYFSKKQKLAESTT